MSWDPSKPATNDAANTLGITTPANFAALDTWANSFTPGVAAGAVTVLHAGGSARTRQKQAMVRVTNSASLGPYTAETSLTWDTETYDTDSMHSTASNTNRLVAPVAGKYDAKFMLNGTFSGGAVPTIILKDNGGTALATAYLTLTPGAVFIAQDVSLSAGGWVEITVSAPSGSITVTTGSSFSLRYVGE